MEKVNMTLSEKIEKELSRELEKSLKDSDFCSLIKRCKLSKEVVLKNNTKLMDTVEELKNCKNCKGLFMCKNKVEGHVLYPLYDGSLKFIYMPCKFQKELEKKMHEKESKLNEISNARMKDIDINDKNRVKVIKWLKNFYDTFEKVNTLKECIENEINKINKLYDKTFEEITKSFEIKHEKLIKQENELKEDLQNKVTKTKEKLENYLTESNSLIRVSEKINKGIKSLEKDENNNMIRILSYIAKINDNKNESNSLLITLMKNLEMGFQEEQTNIKYEEYFFKILI